MSYTRLNPEYQAKGTYLEYKGRASGDFNNLTAPGIYYTQDAMTANKPVTNSLYCYIMVLSYDNVKTQICWQQSLNKTYTRHYAGSPASWGAWSS